MDNPVYVIGGIAVVLLLVAAPVLRRWTRRRAGALGERAGQRFAEDNLAKGAVAGQRLVGRLGETLVVAAPETQTRELVRLATTKGRDYRGLPDGTFEILFADAHAAVVALAAGPEGTLVHVRSFREQHGQPLFAPFWETLRKRIAKAAEAEGVAVSPGPQQRFTREAPASGTDGSWALAP